MGRINIGSMLKALAEYQLLDPLEAGKLLKKILRVLNIKQKNGSGVCSERSTERLDEYQ